MQAINYGAAINAKEFNKLKIIYTHIPKTAGTTFTDILKRNCGNKVSAVTGEDKRNRFINLDFHQKLSYDLVTGHAEYNFDPDIPVAFTWFSFVRDPIKRVVSHYNYCMTNKNHPNHIKMQAENWSFDRFLDAFDSKMYNQQVYYLAGKYFSPSTSTADALTEALNNITNYTFIGIVEAFDACMHYLNIKYNWDTKYEMLNKNELKKISQLTANQGKILQQKNMGRSYSLRKYFYKIQQATQGT